MTLNNSMSITPSPPGQAKGAKFEHGSVLGGKTRAARVSSQWKSTVIPTRVASRISWPLKDTKDNVPVRCSNKDGPDVPPPSRPCLVQENGYVYARGQAFSSFGNKAFTASTTAMTFVPGCFEHEND